jgi:putative endonuclease
MKMTYTVYIIFSIKTNKFYVGQTDNFENRLIRHNKGLVKSTKSGLPWKVIHTFSCSNRSEAMILETKIKNRGISRYLTDNNIKFDIIEV